MLNGRNRSQTRKEYLASYAAAQEDKTRTYSEKKSQESDELIPHQTISKAEADRGNVMLTEDLPRT